MERVDALNRGRTVMGSLPDDSVILSITHSYVTYKYSGARIVPVFRFAKGSM
jgi:hypothetical protein